MARSLADRFYYGNSGWHDPFMPQSGMVDETRKQELAIIHSARQQIDAQNNAGGEIAESDMNGAHIIAAEIDEQTQSLDAAVNEIGERVIGSIISAADQISESIEMLGDRLCVELTEIKWQLTQRNETLEEILEVLHQSRNNEARQLVRQGLRHYINEEFEEAEERFTLALNYDTTDYQVLMNLAFIEIHKGNAGQAFVFFKKALFLPETLDSLSKARTLWAIARLYYATEDFENACTYAMEAFKHGNQRGRALYDLGVYAALAGRISDALERIEQSILIDFSYFSKSAVDPDLSNIRQDILKLLGRLSVDAEAAAKGMVEKAENELAVLENEEGFQHKDNVIEETRKIIKKAVAGLQRPSYSFCRRCTEVMKKVREVISQIRNLIPLYARLKQSQADFEGKNRLYISMRQQHEPGRDIPPAVYVILFCITYILPGYLLANAGSSYEGISWFLLFIIWPLWTALDFLSTHSGITDMAAGALKGLFAAGVMWVTMSLLRKLMKQKSDRILRALSGMEQRFYISERALMAVRHEITTRHNTIREQIAAMRL